MIKAENVRLQDRIGDCDTMVVNLPLSASKHLSNSGLINYMSPDRQVAFRSHRKHDRHNRRSLAGGKRNAPAYTLDGTGVGIAVLDSGMFSDS